MKKKVIVGLSGGVDSSVTSYLLKEQGYEVIGMTMRTWDDSKDDILSQSSDELIINDAKRVAQAIGIEHYVVDFHEEFRKEVINYFIDEYKNARTPNPCVVCNRAIKWKALFTAAEKFIRRHVLQEAEAIELSRDYKTELQEVIQQNPEEKLRYVHTGESGPDHDKTFEVEIWLNSNGYNGT